MNDKLPSLLYLSQTAACSPLCVVCASGPSGVAGVRSSETEEAGLSGHLQRWVDLSSEGHRSSGDDADVYLWRSHVNSSLNQCSYCGPACFLKCVEESVFHIEEIDTEVVTKWVETWGSARLHCLWLENVFISEAACNHYNVNNNNVWY